VQRRYHYPAQPALADFPNVREPAVVTPAQSRVHVGQGCQSSEKQTRIKDLNVDPEFIQMRNPGFDIRRLASLSGYIKTDVAVFSENPTADHPIFAGPLTRRFLHRVLNTMTWGAKALSPSSMYSQVRSHSTTCASASITAIGLAPFFYRFTTTVRAPGPALSRLAAGLCCGRVQFVLDGVSELSTKPQTE